MKNNDYARYSILRCRSTKNAFYARDGYVNWVLCNGDRTRLVGVFLTRILWCYSCFQFLDLPSKHAIKTRTMFSKQIKWVGEWKAKSVGEKLKTIDSPWTRQMSRDQNGLASAYGTFYVWMWVGRGWERCGQNNDEKRRSRRTLTLNAL